VAERIGDRLARVMFQMNTGHWPMFSQSKELTRILLEAV